MSAAGGGTAIWTTATRLDPVHESRVARAALDRGDLAAAIKHSRHVPPRDPRRPRAALIEGEAQFLLGRIEEAVIAYEEAAAVEGPEGVSACLALGELWRSRGCFEKSERYFRKALNRDREQIMALDRLILLMVLSGRRWEALDFARDRIDLGGADLDTYLLVADPERPIENPEYLAQVRQSCPDDPLIAAGLGVQAFSDGRFKDARMLLERDGVRGPGWASVQAVVGELLLSDRSEAFVNWYRRVARDSVDSPEFHLVCGLFAKSRGEFQLAARCFKEAVRLAPNHHRGNYQLSQVAVPLATASPRGGTATAGWLDPGTKLVDRFQRRTSDLSELGRMLERLHKSGGRSESAFKSVIDLLERTGQVRLASQFSLLAANLFPQSSWTKETLTRLAANPLRGTWEIDPSKDLSRFVVIGSAPEFRSWLDRLDSGSTGAPITAVASQITFRQELADRIPFEYRNAHDPSIRGVRMQEQTGGGVAVLDYDRDGWSDLFFPQGGAWPEGSDAPRIDAQSQDCLCRNRKGMAYIDVSGPAGIDAGGFGQGVAAGDLNGDGFPDLYVANIGANNLWINHGDGTFSRVPAEPRGWPDRWTTSCAMVDLNRDGHLDLYDVNYLTGPDIYRIRCSGRACSPKGFAGSPDDVWISNGDGGLSHIPAAIDTLEGKGLGIVAFRIPSPPSTTEFPRVDLLIANDQVPNFLLRNCPGGDTASFHLVNDGFLSGLALNQNGLAMASMGVACDDADHDGLLDFFITNFKDEYDGLYLQRPGGLFQEASTSAGLRGSNVRYVGWGTQFLDADLDGAPDLIAVNGHVDDYRDEGGGFAMPPQFYRNRGNGVFDELPAETLGDYFRSLFHGRGLARVDWNRDGLPDFVVSNVNQPASLVTNTTSEPGRFVKIRLVGTLSDRDAIGTRVRVTAGGQTWEKQLVAGDGYMASNERLLHFGLGTVTRIDSVEALWMSGRATLTSDIPVDREMMLIEDDATRAWAMEHPVSSDRDPNGER